jgi:hypothetical protein
LLLLLLLHRSLLLQQQLHRCHHLWPRTRRHRQARSGEQRWRCGRRRQRARRRRQQRRLRADGFVPLPLAAAYVWHGAGGGLDRENSAGAMCLVCRKQVAMTPDCGPCHAMSCHVMSCHVMSCHVMSCHVMSCHQLQATRTISRPLPCQLIKLNCKRSIHPTTHPGGTAGVRGALVASILPLPTNLKGAKGASKDPTVHPNPDNLGRPAPLRGAQERFGLHSWGTAACVQRTCSPRP